MTQPPSGPAPEIAVGVVTAVSALIVISFIIGFLAKRKAKAFEEWLVGHEDIGPFVTGFALIGAYLSGWAVFGSAGLGYAYGWSGSWLIGTVSIMGISLCLVIGYRMRNYVRLGARTVPEMLRIRFESRFLQALAGLAMIILLIVYSVGQYKAMATVWTVTTGTPFFWSLVASAVLTLIYLAVGGYTGTQWVSGFKGAFLTVVGWALGIAAIIWAGGFAKIAEAMTSQTFTQIGGTPTTMPLNEYTLPYSSAYAGFDYVGVMGTLFMFLFMAAGFPHNLARFLGVRKVTKREFWIMLLIVIVGGLVPLWIGVSGFAARSMWGDALMTEAYKPIYGDSAAAYVSVSAGGVVLSSLFAASVFAAAIATLAGMVMIMATNITRDMINNAFPSASPKRLLNLTRLMLIPFIGIPLWWTLTSPPPILAEFVAGSAVAQAGIFFFVVGVSMYWKRATKWGSIAATICGLVLTIFHPNAYGKTVGLAHWGYWALLLMFGSALSYVAFSLLTKPVSKKTLDQLF